MSASRVHLASGAPAAGLSNVHRRRCRHLETPVLALAEASTPAMCINNKTCQKYVSGHAQIQGLRLGAVREVEEPSCARNDRASSTEAHARRRCPLRPEAATSSRLHYASRGRGRAVADHPADVPGRPGHRSTRQGGRRRSRVRKLSPAADPGQPACLRPFHSRLGLARSWRSLRSARHRT